MTKRQYILLIFIFSLIAVPYGINYIKQQQIKLFEQSTYVNLVNKTEQTLKTLIREKQNTTTTIALGLANNESLKNFLIDPKNHFYDLKGYSKQLRNTTTFKNVWFQLINKDGISIQRSWTDYKGDRIADARLDLQLALKNPKISNTISVGKFDMTFKTMSPVYDKGKFLGFIEVITHFNSIDKKLQTRDISSVILADKSYTKQITKPFTKKFVGGYYIANLGAKQEYLTYLGKKDLSNFIDQLSKKDFIIDEKLESIISYYQLKNVKNAPMGHFLLFHPMDMADLSKIKEMEYFYNILTILSIITLLALFYFSDILFPKEENVTSTSYSTFAFILIVYIILASIIYFVIKEKYDADIFIYNENAKNQTLLEYDSILKNKQDIAKLIFSNVINKEQIKKLMLDGKREELYKILKDDYESFKKNYNIRQLHFHLPDATSFLRVHKPKKFGDNLSGIRESVVYTNREKKYFTGFEEGRIYNGFRNVFPLFYEDIHIGSVEISFDIYSIIHDYIKTFNVKTVNFLVNKDVIDKKVFESEKNNYVNSPIDGFAFDNYVLQKLKELDKPNKYYKKDVNTLQQMAPLILEGKAFNQYFDNLNELTTVIPLNNIISGQVMGSIHISKEAKYIQNRSVEFYQLIFTIMIVLAFIMIFIHREILSKYKLSSELKKNQVILDSQKSFIIITSGEDLQGSNKSLLEFFNFNSFKEFKSIHNCICEFFIEEDGYLQENMGELNWFEYLLTSNNKNNLVKMKNINTDQEHIFYIEFDEKNKIGENYLLSFIDITDFKSMEKKLVENEKMASLGSMIGNIAHQWRQPLSVITTLASGIQMKQEFGKLDSDSINTSMEDIIKNSNYLSETIDTFRDYIKEDKSQKEQIIQEIISSTLKILEPSLKNNHILLIQETICEQAIVKTMVVGELQQVITNLINNAKDVLCERKIQKPEIIISCNLVENTIEISVEDNAGGIPEDIITKVFEPYFTTKHQSVGTGLGLYMSQKIIKESFQGELLVKNTQNGAKFSIQIPL